MWVPFCEMRHINSFSGDLKVEVLGGGSKLMLKHLRSFSFHYRHIRNSYLSNSKTLQDGNGNGNGNLGEIVK